MTITRLYVDSNILIGLGWPKQSDDLDYLFSLAQVVRVSAFLPELVEIETEAKCSREFEKKKRGVEESLRALAGHASTFVPPTLEMPTVDSARAAYAAAAEAAKQQWGLQTCPTTSSSLGELLKKAAFHEPPFLEKDSSFRDAVILVSISDHLDQGDPTEAILVSNDTFFKRSELKHYHTPRESIIHQHDDVGAAADALTPKLQDVILSRWTNDRAQATEALESDRANIEQFIRNNLEVPVGGGLFFLLGPRVLEVQDVRMDKIGTVKIPPPFRKPKDDVVQASFDVVVFIDQVVEISQAVPPPNVLRVGQTLEPPVRPYPSPTIEQVERPAIVTVQARAHVEAGRYRSFDYVSVKMRDGESAALAGLRRAL